MDIQSILDSLPPEANLQLPDPSLLNYYTDLKERIYYITYGIDDGLYGLVHQIVNINRQDRDIDPMERKPIRIVIASPGGSLEVGESLAQIIKASMTPIYTIGIGMVASAASLIYLAGHKRYATKNTQWLFHEGSCDNIGGNFDEVQKFMENYKKEIDELHRYYVNTTKYTEEEINKGLKTDWYIDTAEALEKGVVDEIIDTLDVML